MQHEHLPPAVGLRLLDRLRPDVAELLELAASDELADERIVLRRVRVVSVRAFLEVGMAVVGARDERDSSSERRGRGRDRGTRFDVR